MGTSLIAEARVVPRIFYLRGQTPHTLSFLNFFEFRFFFSSVVLVFFLVFLAGATEPPPLAPPLCTAPW